MKTNVKKRSKIHKIVKLLFKKKIKAVKERGRRRNFKERGDCRK